MAEQQPDSAVEAIYRAARQGLDPMAVRAPRMAVSVVLWRRPRTRQPEIYLAKRADSLAFLPGWWTFPGGAIDSQDHQTEIAGASGERACQIATCIRETHEETGLTLPARADRFTYLGRLVTPEVVSIRFDAAVYLVEVDADAVVDYRASQGELQDGLWISPRAALDRQGSADWMIPLPTQAVIEALGETLCDNGPNSTTVPIGVAERCGRACERVNQWPRAYPLIPGIWLSPVRTPTLPPATTTNCYIVGGQELVVIDPASPYDTERTALDDALDELCARGRRVVAVWLTHHHGDHMSGAAHLAERLGVPVAAHRATAERVADRVRVDQILDDDDVCELAGETPDAPTRRLRVIFTPGHAPGHICILEETSGFMIAGDMVAGVGSILVEPVDGDMHLYLESLRRMREIGPDALLPAHGPMILKPRAKLDTYIEHRLWREKRVVQALRTAGPASSRALVPHAYDDVPPMIWPLAQRSLIAHLLKLERDGVAARDSDPAARDSDPAARDSDPALTIDAATVWALL